MWEVVVPVPSFATFLLAVRDFAEQPVSKVDLQKKHKKLL